VVGAAANIREVEQIIVKNIAEQNQTRFFNIILPYKKIRNNLEN